MAMTDEELDRDWQPNGRRPQSTIAQMFSQELMDIFRIDNSVADLDEQVDKKKQQINSQTSELEALEARIREMERRLKMQTNADNPADDSRAHTDDSAPQPAEKDRPMMDQSREQEHQQQQKYSGSRPSTARQSQQAVPCALPPTPAGSEGECDAPVVAHPPPRIVPRWPAVQTQGQPHPRAVRPNNACKPPQPSPLSLASASCGDGMMMPEPLGDDSDSVQPPSQGATFADYVIVPEPDGDRERDA